MKVLIRFIVFEINDKFCFTGIEKYLHRQNEFIKNKIESTNLSRKASQEAVHPTLQSLSAKRDQTIYKCMNIEKRCVELENIVGRDEAKSSESASRKSQRDELLDDRDDIKRSKLSEST